MRTIAPAAASAGLAGRAGTAVLMPPSKRKRRAAPVVPAGSFIINLESWRLQMGLEPGQFASYLGISRSYWAKLRQGVRRAGPQLIARVLKERPDFYPYVASEFTRF
jgi:hypothetical protein